MLLAGSHYKASPRPRPAPLHHARPGGWELAVIRGDCGRALAKKPVTVPYANARRYGTVGDELSPSRRAWPPYRRQPKNHPQI